MLKLGSILAAYALVVSFLDPTWNPLAPGSLYFFCVMLVTVAACGYADSLGQSFTLRRWKVEHRFDFWPANLFVSAAAVLVSRIVPLQPGIIFGAPGGIGVEEAEVSAQRQLTLRWAGLAAIVALVVMSWTASGIFAALSLTVNGTAEAVTSAAHVMVALLNLSLAVFLAAIQTLFFQLIPVANTYGRDLWNRRKLVWALLFIPSGLVLSRIMINPNDGPATAFTRSPVQFLVAFLVVYVLFTTGLWFYFHPHQQLLGILHLRLRRGKDEPRQDGNDGITAAK